MRHSRRHGQLKLITEISITPLLDLVFILLFAFMVALPLVSQSDALLQPASTVSGSMKQPPIKSTTVIVNGPDSLLWNGQSVTPAQLESSLRDEIRLQADLGVILQVEQQLPIASLVGAMTTLQKAGVQRTAIRLSLDNSLQSTASPAAP
jgi:biopolymer transport protein ExbD